MEYAKAEPEERRGRAQTLLQMVSTAGYFVSVAIVAFGFNGRMFTGSFSQQNQLSYQQAVAILAAMCLVTGVARMSIFMFLSCFCGFVLILAEPL